MSIQRYRRKAPSDAVLAQYAASGATIADFGAELVDVNLNDNADKSDLDDFMQDQGFEFFETDPVTSALVKWQRPVLSELGDPPPTPSTGDRYRLNGAPINAWAGHPGEIAEWDGTQWVFTVPTSGTVVLEILQNAVFSFVTGIWQNLTRSIGFTLQYGAVLAGGDVGSFLTANGIATSPPVVGLSPASELTMPAPGRVLAIGWNSDSADATTQLRLTINGAVAETINLTGASGSAGLGGVNALSGNTVAIEYEGGTAPGNMNVLLYFAP